MRLRQDNVWPGRLPEPGNRNLKCQFRTLNRCLSPKDVDDPVRRDRSWKFERQERYQCSESIAGERNHLSGRIDDFDRTEQAQLELARTTHGTLLSS